MSIEFNPHEGELLPHLPEKLLDQYLLDQLDEGNIAAIEEHLFICPGCRRRLQANESFVSALRVAAGRGQSK